MDPKPLERTLALQRTKEIGPKQETGSIRNNNPYAPLNASYDMYVSETNDKSFFLI